MSEGSSRLRGDAVAVMALGVEDPPAGIFQYWQMARSSDFIRKVFETYATRLLIVGIGLVTTILVARLLGPEGRGFYAVAAATGALGVQFGNLGLHTANVYFAARDPESVASLVGNSLVVSIGLGGLIAVALAVIFTFAPNLISLQGTVLFLALSCIPLGLTYLLLQSLLLGVHDVRGYNLLETAGKVLPLVLIGALVFVRRVGVSSFFATGLIALIVNDICLLRRLREHFVGLISVSLALFRNSIEYAVKAYLAAFFAFLVLRADLFMVQHLLGPEQAGYYSIASAMADYVSVLAFVVGTILLPKLSALKDVETKLWMTRKAAWGTAALLFPVLAASALLAKPAVRLLFGASFLPAAGAFILLMPGMLFLGINAVAVQFLNSIGYPKIVVIIWGLCSIGNIGFNLWVIPRYGIAGASLVSSISYFLAFLFINRVIRRTGSQLRAVNGASLTSVNPAI